jgi:hypothetical protein
MRRKATVPTAERSTLLSIYQPYWGRADEHAVGTQNEAVVCGDSDRRRAGSFACWQYICDAQRDIARGRFQRQRGRPRRGCERGAQRSRYDSRVLPDSCDAGHDARAY